MVLIMVTSIFPSERADEVKKKYNEIQEKLPLPSYMKQKMSGLRWVRDGMKGVAVYDVENGNVANALNFIYRYELEYGGIADYSNDIETLLAIDDMTGILSP